MAGWSKIPRDLELECYMRHHHVCLYIKVLVIKFPSICMTSPLLFIDKVNFAVTPNNAFFTQYSSSVPMHGHLASYHLLSSIDFLFFLAYKHVQGFTCGKSREYHILPKLSSATWKVWNFFPYLSRKLLGCLLPPTSLLSIFKSWLMPDNIQRVRNLRTHSTKWSRYIKSLPSGLRELSRRCSRENLRASGDGGHQGNRPSEHRSTDTRMSSQGLWQHALSLYESTRDKGTSSERRSGGHKLPSLTQNW